MVSRILKSGILALMASASLMQAAHAGGFNRGTADTDILFDVGRNIIRSSLTVVSPTAKMDRINGTPVSGFDAKTYVVPSFAAKVTLTDDLACAATYTTPFGGNSSYKHLSMGGAPFGYDPLSPSGSISQKFTVQEYGATCAYGFDVGRGRLSLLGGLFMQDLEFNQVIQAQLAPPPALRTPSNFYLEDRSYGYRVGVAYEIPEMAFRTQLMYRSGVTHNATGDVSVAANGAMIVPYAIGTAPFPQSVEFKVQTGVAPGWLVYGGVKWTDWSVFKSVNFNAGVPSSLNFFWRDGWTVNAGVGHKFTDKLSGTVGVIWDNGTSTGYDLNSLETWSIVSGVSYKATDAIELRAGAGYSFISPGTQNYYDSGLPGVSVSLPNAKHRAAGHALSGNLSLQIRF